LGGTGEETRDWLHIADAARMLVSAAGLASTRVPCLNGCTGTPVSVRDTVQALARGFGVEVQLDFNGQVREGDPRHLVGRPSAGLVASVAPLEGLARFAADFAASR